MALRLLDAVLVRLGRLVVRRVVLALRHGVVGMSIDATDSAALRKNCRIYGRALINIHSTGTIYYKAFGLDPSGSSDKSACMVTICRPCEDSGLTWTMPE